MPRPATSTTSKHLYLRPAGPPALQGRSSKVRTFERNQRRGFGRISSSLREQLEGRRPRRLAATRDINHIETFIPAAGGAAGPPGTIVEGANVWTRLTSRVRTDLIIIARAIGGPADSPACRDPRHQPHRNIRTCGRRGRRPSRDDRRRCERLNAINVAGSGRSRHHCEKRLEGRRPRRLAATRDINHIDLYLVQSNYLPNYLPSNFKLQTK